MRWIELTEKRRNPEVNVKKTTLEELMKYEDKNVFVSFVADVGVLSHNSSNAMTNVHNDRDRSGLRASGDKTNQSGHKIGINPRSQFNTPNGIYCYPIDYVISLFKNNRWDFGTNRPFVYVIEPTSNLLISSQYTEEMFERDTKKLVELYDIDPKIVADYSLTRFKPSENIWRLTRLIANKDSTKDNNPNKWSAIFRSIGYSGFFDSNGEGIIHKNEPLQCVFFSKNAFKVLEVIHNLGRAINPDNPIGIYKMYEKGLITDKSLANYILGENGAKLVDLIDIKHVTRNLAIHLMHLMQYATSQHAMILLLKAGVISDREIESLIYKNIYIVQYIDQYGEYLNDAVIENVYERVNETTLMSNPNVIVYFLKRGVVSDEDLLRIINDNPTVMKGIVKRGIDIPERLYSELFKNPKFVAVMPELGLKYADKKTIFNAVPYLRRKLEYYNDFPDYVLKIIAEKYPDDMSDAYAADLYKPTPLIWNVLFKNIGDSEAPRLLFYLIGNGELKLALEFTKRIEPFVVSLMLGKSPNVSLVKQYIDALPIRLVINIINEVDYYRYIDSNIRNMLEDRLK